MRSVRRRRSLSGDPERGSIIVELAIVVPLLMTILLGMFEIAMAWRVTQTAVQSTRSGARTATQLGDQDLADWAALNAMVATFGRDAENITGVIIWEVPQDAQGFPTSDAVPAACRAAIGPATPIYTGAVNCNVYGPADINDVANKARFDATPNDSTNGCSGGRSSNWCPSSNRVHAQQVATYIGVWVEYERDYVSHVLPGDSHKIRESAIMRVEPKTSQ